MTPLRNQAAVASSNPRRQMLSPNGYMKMQVERLRCPKLVGTSNQGLNPGLSDPIARPLRMLSGVRQGD